MPWPFSNSSGTSSGHNRRLKYASKKSASSMEDEKSTLSTFSSKSQRGQELTPFSYWSKFAQNNLGGTTTGSSAKDGLLKHKKGSTTKYSTTTATVPSGGGDAGKGLVIGMDDAIGK